MKTLIIGLGNPILGDDGVGWKAAEAVKAVIGNQSSVEVDCASLGGLSLMERMLGYQRVILIDSMETGQSPEGSVRVFPLFALPNPTAGHTASAHDTSLLNALRAARTLGADVPERVDVVAIETKSAYDFSEELSEAVSAAVPIAVQKVIKLLRRKPLKHIHNPCSQRSRIPG
jgi:hydrogenase maturation protease